MNTIESNRVLLEQLCGLSLFFARDRCRSATRYLLLLGGGNLTSTITMMR